MVEVQKNLMSRPRACLRRRCPAALSRGLGQRHPPSAGTEPRYPGTGDRLCAAPSGAGPPYLYCSSLASHAPLSAPGPASAWGLPAALRTCGEDATVSGAGWARHCPETEPSPNRHLTPGRSPPRRAAPIADILSAPRPLWRRLRPGNRRPPALAPSLPPSLSPPLRPCRGPSDGDRPVRTEQLAPVVALGCQGSGEGQEKRAEEPLQLLA